MVNKIVDFKARKTGCSVSLTNEMWGLLDLYAAEKFGGRLTRSGYIEDFIRQTLENWKREKEEGNNETDLVETQDGQLIPTSVNTMRAYLHRIKDFVAENSKEQKTGNLEAIRRDLVEGANFIEQEIRRAREPTKSDKRRMELEKSIAAHRALLGTNPFITKTIDNEEGKGEVEGSAKEVEPTTTTTIQPEITPTAARPEFDPVDLEYERILKEAYTDYKEEPLPSSPKPDDDIIDEGKTRPNIFNNDNEEVFL